jgi:RNA polymerase sigma-70 factor (ECF subfamily)
MIWPGPLETVTQILNSLSHPAMMFHTTFIGDTNANFPPTPSNEWIASRRDAVKHYLWKKWNLCDDDLEDVLQETMMAALQSFANYEGRNNAEPGTYLIGIAKNVVQSFFRRRDRHEHRRAPIELAESIGVVFRDKTEAEELAKLLREKFSKLPKIYVQVLKLIYYQDYKERDAAAELGIPVGKLYSLKSDALKRLRKLCKKDERFRL